MRNFPLPDFGLWTLDRLRRWAGLLLAALWVLILPPASAQTGVGGWMIQIYGMVQVEPGANVLTLGVKNEEIRFVVHNLRSSDRNFSMARFLSETKIRTPGVLIRGPDTMLETLIKERPRKRVLKLSGLYYPDSRVFVLNGLEQFHETPKRDF
jgi:hypothetical protein